jgi:hypothetical protein
MTTARLCEFDMTESIRKLFITGFELCDCQVAVHLCTTRPHRKNSETISCGSSFNLEAPHEVHPPRLTSSSSLAGYSQAWLCLRREMTANGKASRLKFELGIETPSLPRAPKSAGPPYTPLRPKATAIPASSVEMSADTAGPSTLMRRQRRRRKKGARRMRSLSRRYCRYFWTCVVRSPARPCWSIECCQERNSSTVSM